LKVFIAALYRIPTEPGRGNLLVQQIFFSDRLLAYALMERPSERFYRLGGVGDH